ncbi:MAG: ATP-binding cassette domain-containing protein, partial [Actinomycetes bacterium]
MVSAVDGVDFAVNKGETLAIVGESGSGKSVTSQAIMGLINRKTATVSGEVLLDGEDIYAPGMPVAKTRLRIGMVFQRPNPFPTMSIGE